MNGATTFNIEVAVRDLIDRVDRLERALRDVQAVLPQPSILSAPMRESIAGPSDRDAADPDEGQGS